MAVARGLVKELFVTEDEPGTAACRLEPDRHQRLALRRGAPGPGEGQQGRETNLAVDAADVMAFTVAGDEGDPVAATDLDIDVDVEDRLTACEIVYLPEPVTEVPAEETPQLITAAPVPRPAAR